MGIQPGHIHKPGKIGKDSTKDTLTCVIPTLSKVLYLALVPLPMKPSLKQLGWDLDNHSVLVLVEIHSLEHNISMLSRFSSMTPLRKVESNSQIGNHSTNGMQVSF